MSETAHCMTGDCRGNSYCPCQCDKCRAAYWSSAADSLRAELDKQKEKAEIYGRCAYEMGKVFGWRREYQHSDGKDPLWIAMSRCAAEVLAQVARERDEAKNDKDELLKLPAMCMARAQLAEMRLATAVEALEWYATELEKTIGDEGPSDAVYADPNHHRVATFGRHAIEALEKIRAQDKETEA